MAKYVRIEDVAELLKISATTAERWLKEENKPIIKKRKAPPEDDIYEKIEIVSEMLDLPEKTIRKWANTNKMPNSWAGGTRLHFKTSDIIKWANKKGDMSALDDSNEQ